MREILFRAKRIDYDKFPKEEWWIEGNAFVHDDGRTVDISTGTEKFSINKRVISETLCQYTGLKDENGNRIWENDILHIIEKMRSDVYRNGNYVSSPRWINESNFKVEFTPGGMMNTQRYANNPDIICEVIGNIFDNPELLKGE